MRKVILVIRDGWGFREDATDNAIASASTPVHDRLIQQYPSVLLDASGEAVGLPSGVMGNSEVGHLTIGSGRIMFQSMMRINKSIKDRSFFSNKILLDALENAKDKTLHLIGLLQDEGVHSHIDHLFAILDACKQQQVTNVKIHAITDGRDAPVTKSLEHVRALEEKLQQLGFGEIVTISGRYFAMDRDKRWDRTQKAYNAIVLGKANAFTNVQEQISSCHQSEETDEFIVPRVKEGYGGFQKSDTVIFWNFRTDRPRQLTQAIIEPKFPGWKREPFPVHYVAMTQFYNPMQANVLFEDHIPEWTLGEVIANAGLNQLRISETEKYAHVTFFFNGQREEPFEKEERILIHSPKVATYDLQPEMSVFEIRDTLLEKIKEEKYELIVVNLVNDDMVGHTGIPEAIVKAVEAVDAVTGEIVDTGLQHNYDLIVFADHGNAEDQTPQWRTSHTTHPVPCIFVTNDEDLKQKSLKQGKGIKDIAPTTLALLGIDQPKQMSGENLLE